MVRFPQLILFSLSLSALGQEKWVHVKLGPDVLSDDLIEKVYPTEKLPARHNGITVSDYLNQFDSEVLNVGPNCFRPQIKAWQVVSHIYVRPKKLGGSGGEILKNPRWQELSQFQCRSLDKNFNTWEGTLYHEEQHFALRDQKLESFWKNFRTVLKSYCAKSEKEAENFLEQQVKGFLIGVREADKEELAETKEHAWYAAAFRKKTHRSCNRYSFLESTFPNFRMTHLKSGLMEVTTSNGAKFLAIEKGVLLVLVAQPDKKSTYTFQNGVLMAKELFEGGERVRYEYKNNTRLLSKIWLNDQNIAIAKAWATSDGILGPKVIFQKDNSMASESAMVAVLDTGYGASDSDGHGTFVQNILRSTSALDAAQVLSIKTTTNLDQSLWGPLEKIKVKIINLSIGQGANSSEPPTKESIERTCRTLKEVSQKTLLIIGAGNDGASLENAPFYPAACEWDSGDNVLVVGAWDTLNQMPADFGGSASNWSAKKLHVMVSGGLYESELPGGVKSLKGGTSFAAPYIAGLAAKILKKAPTLRASELRDSVLRLCVPSPFLKKYALGSCLIKRRAL